MTIRLIKPTITLKEQYMDYFMEWKLAGEKMSPRVLGKMDPTNFNNMIQTLNELEKAETEGNVPETIYWLIDDETKIIGAVTIRHELTQRMFNTEGHIGAGIRPSERRKGYATKILELVLDKMREMGYSNALVTCNEDNIGSERAILKNEGIRDNDFLEAHGNIVKRYWIKL